MYIHIFVFFSSSDMVWRRMVWSIIAKIWCRPFERYICKYVCHSAPKFVRLYLSPHEKNMLYHISKFSSSPDSMFSKLSVVEFRNWRQFGDSNPFFIIYQNTHVVSIWQKDFMLDEICNASKWNASARVTCQHHWARIVYAPSMSFYFPDFVSVIVTGWQDFAASLTEKCQSAISSAIYKLHASYD